MCDVFLCFSDFPYSVSGQVCYLIVSIPDLCLLFYLLIWHCFVIYSLTSLRDTGRFLAKHTFGHFHIKIGKTECIYSPVKRFTAVYLYIPVVVLSPIVRKRHLELIWITRRLTSLDICALTMFRNFNYSNYKSK